jgi:hypothetical protein
MFTSAALVIAALAQPGYSPRGEQVVYDNLSRSFQTGTHGFLGLCNQALEDVRFAGGPWDGRRQRLITTISVGVGIYSVSSTPEESVFVVVWDEDDVNFEGVDGPGTSMIRPGAEPLGVVSFSPGVRDWGFAWHFDIDVRVQTNGGIRVPDDDGGVVVQLGWGWTAALPGVTDWSRLPAGTLIESCPGTNRRGISFASNSLEPASLPGANPATVGRTSASYGRDMLAAATCGHAGWFVGAAGPPATGGNVEHRTVVLTPAQGPNAGVSTLAGIELMLRGVLDRIWCDGDFNGDGVEDLDDVAYLIGVVAGAPNPSGRDPDFNCDGNVDQEDIWLLVHLIMGGSCP